MQGIHYVYNWADLEAQYVRLGLSDCLTNSRQLADRMRCHLLKMRPSLPQFPTSPDTWRLVIFWNLTQVALEALAQ